MQDKIKNLLIVALCLFLVGCSNQTSDDKVTVEPIDSEQKILVAYFTRLNNTEANNVDEIITGGGPYGSVDKDDIDSLSSASIQINGDDYKGNTEILAEMINDYVDGTMFSIKTVEKYPVNYDFLIDQGNQENSQDIRPELSSHVENFNDYDIVFIGYPDWYYDMPMAVCTFLEEYDFSNKTIIPFCTSAGSGFASSLDTLESLLPDSTTILDGLAVEMENVTKCKGNVKTWLDSLGL